MLIHGRLILTASGLMLDEVKSLLQKSLRRKDHDLTTKAAKELLGRGKDQLQWKSLVTYMFEDHCLNDVTVLLKMVNLHQKKDKYGCIELMLKHCGTCRIAACLPVIAMAPEYDPVNWDSDILIDDELQGLVSRQTSRINFDLLLQHLKNAWTEKNITDIITYMKMATMVVDHDKRSVTTKGQSYCLFSDKVKPQHVGTVVLTMLSKASNKIGNKQMTQYARLCCYLSTIPEVPVRLIIFAVVTQYIHSDVIKTPGATNVGNIIWNSVEKLTQMPHWAVDKHTFRGKYGKGTTHILKKPDAKKLTESELEEFHGNRPKRDIDHFFSEGVLCVEQIVDVNPYWDQCVEMYKSRPKSLQKTVRMTAVYYQDQLEKFPTIKGKKPSSKRKGSESDDDTSEQNDDGIASRMTRKKVKLTADDKRTKDEKDSRMTASSSIVCDAKERDPKPDTKSDGQGVHRVIQELEAPDEPCLDGPLLQLPTGSGKMYTRADLANKVVWKGPYKVERVQLAMFLHRAMTDVFEDPHTLTIARKELYVRFPLIYRPGSSMRIIEKNFYDCIGKKQVAKGQFVSRDSLGIIQVHNMVPWNIKKLPPTFWCHFLFRYVLNVGDSGLYNSITDNDLTFLFGIDMEESRRNVTGNDVLNLMFVKLPKKEICNQIKASMKQQKTEISQILSKNFDLSLLSMLGKFYKINFDVDQVTRRLDTARKAIDKL